MTTEMSELEKVIALSDKATQGEWHSPGLGEVHDEQHRTLVLAKYPDSDEQTLLYEHDAEFIAALVNWFRANSAEIVAKLAEKGRENG